MAALTRLRKRWRSDSGAEFVEFALAFPLLLLVVMGIVDFGMLFQQYEVITNAAREGARIAVLPNYSSADVATRVQQYIAAGGIFSIAPAAATVSVGNPQTVMIGSTCMSTVTVSVSYPHNYFFLSGIASYFGGAFGTRTLNASSTMRTEVAGTCS